MVVLFAIVQMSFEIWHLVLFVGNFTTLCTDDCKWGRFPLHVEDNHITKDHGSEQVSSGRQAHKEDSQILYQLDNLAWVDVDSRVNCYYRC